MNGHSIANAGILGRAGSDRLGIGSGGIGILSARSTPMSGNWKKGSFGSAGKESDGMGNAGIGSRTLRSTPMSGRVNPGNCGSAGSANVGSGIAGIGRAILHIAFCALLGCAKERPQQVQFEQQTQAPSAPAQVISSVEESRAAARYAASQLGMLADAASRAQRENAAACRGRFMAVRPVRDEIRDKLDSADPQTPGLAPMQEAMALSLFCLGCDDSFREACPKLKAHVAEAERAMTAAGF